ncbi:MAG TPA: LysM peptidoglycan-binding domain-containing protein [Flavobacterium sp.]|jgi:LysM repeat protein
MRKLVVLFVAFSLHNLSAQEYEIINHTVQMGETVRMISKKYRAEPAEIYRLNKFAIDGIRQGMVLHIPALKKEITPAKTVVQAETPAAVESVAEPEQTAAVQETAEQEITHTVAPKETLYSLSRKYNVPVEEIKRQNEKQLSKGLQTGQVLTIRITN